MIKKREAAKKRAVRPAFCLSIGLFLTALTGCGNDTIRSGGIRNEKGYSRSEIMVIAMTEKNRYEAVCTDQIWKVSLGTEGEAFESYLKEQIQSFMDEVRIMNLLAGERKMTLTAEERAAMSEAAEEYYNSLTEADISYMGVTREEVKGLFEDYRLAERLVEEVTAGIDLEVSDSEAKVISFQQAECKSRQEAEAFLIQASEADADFETCAEKAGIPTTTRQLGRGEETKAFEEAAFALESGEVSGVVEAAGVCYVLKCISDYDEEATAARKKAIFEERKRRAFQAIYDEFRENIVLSYSDDVWESISLAGGSYAQEADFFEIYRKYAE